MRLLARHGADKQTLFVIFFLALVGFLFAVSIAISVVTVLVSQRTNKTTKMITNKAAEKNVAADAVPAAQTTYRSSGRRVSRHHCSAFSMAFTCSRRGARTSYPISMPESASNDFANRMAS